MVSRASVNELAKLAKRTRQEVLEMCARSGEGRVASAFSCIEMLVALFHGGILRYDVKNLHWEERDRFIMSKSPGVVGLYPILCDVGFFPENELDNYCQDCSLLGPYSGNVPGNIPGVEAYSGKDHWVGIAL